MNILHLLFKGALWWILLWSKHSALIWIWKSCIFPSGLLEGKAAQSYNLVAKIPLLFSIQVLLCGQAPVNHRIFWLGFLCKGHTPSNMLTSHRMSHLPPVWLTHLGKFLLLGICYSWSTSPKKFWCFQVHLEDLAEAQEVCGLGINMVLHLAPNIVRLFGKGVWGTSWELSRTAVW